MSIHHLHACGKACVLQLCSIYCRDTNTVLAKLREYFLNTCAQNSNRIAIITDAHNHDYNTLRMAAIEIQTILKVLGVKQSQVVAICFPRSAALVAAVLGCILHGAVFLLVDSSLPPDRLKLHLEISKPCVLLSESKIHSVIGSVIKDCTSVLSISVHVDDTCILSPPVLSGSKKIRESFMCCDDTIYIIFTSGSTGNPKAVCASALGTLNRFEWMWDQYPFHPNDVVCFKTSINFVDCVWEMLGATLKGVPLAIPLEENAKDARLLSASIKKWNVTRLLVVPSYLQYLLELRTASENLRSLTICISSGEPLSKHLVATFLKVLPLCKLLNLYGTSEICGDITFFEVTSHYLLHTSSSVMPIGKPIPNIRITVVDPITSDIIPSTSSRTGELLTYGICVAHSYLNLECRSLSCNGKNVRCFSTGDLVHYNSRGDLMYVGRKDHQIKVRGIKINPVEIESAIEKSDCAEKAIVSTDESHMNLIGIIQIRQSSGESFSSGHNAIKYGDQLYFTNSQLAQMTMRQLTELLPYYLVPSVFIFTHSLPTLPSGKVSRNELPPMSGIKMLLAQPITDEAEFSKTEELLCDAFKKTLHLTSVPLAGDFFALGGNSLSIVDLASKIEDVFCCSISTASILSSPTIKSLAALIDKEVASVVAPHVSDVSQQRTSNSTTGPLYHSQENMWLYDAMAMCNVTYVGIAAVCSEQLDLDLLRDSIFQLSKEMESLRTTFPCNEYGQPFQKTTNPGSQEYFDMLKTAYSVEDSSKRCPLHFKDGHVTLSPHHFDISNGPMWKLTLFTNVQIPEYSIPQSIVAFEAHHLITDGWSLNLLTSELENIYMQLSKNNEIVNYSNPSGLAYLIKLAEIEQSKVINKESLKYWEMKLHNTILPPSLHPKCIHTTLGNHALAMNKTFSIHIADVKAFCQANSVSEFVFVFTGLLAAIYALTGLEDILAILPFSNRSHKDNYVAGCFMDLIPLRTTFCGTSSLHSLLMSVKSGIVDSIKNKIPWQLLLKEFMKRGKMMPDASISSGIFHQLLFVFDYENNAPFSESHIFKDVPVNILASVALIDFYVSSTPNISVQVAHSERLYDAETVQVLLDTWDEVMTTNLKHVHANVALKQLCGEFHIPTESKPYENGLKCLYTSPKHQENSIAVLLNSDNAITWHQIYSVESSLYYLMSKFHSRNENSPKLLAHIQFSPLAIALVVAATQLKNHFAFWSSLNEMAIFMLNPEHGSTYLVMVNDDAEQEYIQSFIETQSVANITLVTIQSFINCIPVSPVPSKVFLMFNSTMWNSDIALCAEVFSTYFNDVSSVAILASPQSSAFAICVFLILQGIQVQIITPENVSFFFNTAHVSEVDMIVLPEISLPRVLPNLPNCRSLQHIWVYGLPFGLAHISKWITSAMQNVQVVVTHSLVHTCLITHHIRLNGLSCAKDGSFSCIPVGSLCQGLDGKLLHKDGREVCCGYPGRFSINVNGHTHLSTSLIRQRYNDGLFELLSVNAKAYYEGTDVTPALFVLSTIPEVSWCGMSSGAMEEGIMQVLYSVDVDASKEISLRRKVVQLLSSNLSLAFAGATFQMPEPPLISHDLSTSLDQFSSAIIQPVHWLLDDLAVPHLTDHQLLDKICNIVCEAFGVDHQTVMLAPDLLLAGGSSFANILSLTVLLNNNFGAFFTTKDVFQAVRNGCLVTLVMEARHGPIKIPMLEQQ